MSSSAGQEEFTKALILEAKYYYDAKQIFKKKLAGECDLYIINDKWIHEWKEYVSYSSIKSKLIARQSLVGIKPKWKSKPGAIDNSSLFLPFNSFVNNGNIYNQFNYVIPANRKKNVHYRCISKEIWESFEFKYSGGPIIIKHKTKRSRIEECLYSIQFKVVIIPMKEYLTKDYICNMEPLVFYAEPNDSVAKFKSTMLLTLKESNCLNALRQFFPEQGINENQCLLWKFEGAIDFEAFKKYCYTNFNEIIESKKIIQSMVAGTANLDLERETPVKAIKSKGDLFILEGIQRNSSTQDKQIQSITTKPRKPQSSTNILLGLSGLHNLGNTCFMNTSIQCLSNCGLLTDYFLRDYYKPHINKSSPIGSKGVLVSAYAHLLKNMWNGSNMPISPQQFKSAISSFQSLFTGFSQQDTHEFLIYLLDGLHEDLNLVLKKPYIKEDDVKGSDEEVYRIKWVNFLKRNQSIISDLFYGVYKSTIHCLNESCGNTMSVFEPYLSVNVPLTVNNINCFFLFYDISISPIQIKIPLENDRYLGSLRNKLSLVFNVKPFSFLTAYITNKGVLKSLFNSEKPLLEIERIFCFQIDPSFTSESQCNYSQIFSQMEKRRSEIDLILNQEGSIDNMPTKQPISYTKSSNTLQVNIDNNNYLPLSFIKVILNLYTNDFTGKNTISFPRIIYVKKEWSTRTLHMKIINYFSHLLMKENKLKDNENVLVKCFPNLAEVIQSNNEVSEQQQQALNYPFVLQFKPLDESKKCSYCGKFHCRGCLIPFEEHITISDIIEEGTQREKDNTFYYIAESDREAFNLTNNDFEIDVIWLEKYRNAISSLNERKEFNFTHSEPEIELNQCLKRFEYPEILDGDNKVFCSRCKKLQKVSKQLELYTIPIYLIIQLKRFSRNGIITTKVNFPFYDFNISKYVKKQTKQLSAFEYDLIAIANHYGNLSGGHYFAYARNYLNNNWYEYNDSQVSQISEDNLVTSNAYVLFYQRKGIETYVNKDCLYTKQFIDYSKK